MSNVLVRRLITVGAVALVVGAAACVAPAELDVDVGRSVEVRYDAAAVGVEPRAVLDALQAELGEGGPDERAEPAEGAKRDVSFGVRKEGTGVVVRAEIWGTGLPDEPLADKLRKALPALKDAAITEEPLQGSVRGTLGEKIGHDLFNINVADAKDVEEARQQVLKQLAARGIQGKVDVQVEGEGKKRKVMIKVEKEECDPDQEAPSNAADTQAP